MKITIATINLNNRDGLEKTIQSVINQTYFDNIEFIIKDGGSTDGSVDIVKKYEDKIDFWESGEDGGIFQAFNFLIPHINGEYCLFLNSGDIFHANDVVEKAVPLLDKDICYGNEMKVGRRVNVARFSDRLDEYFFKTSALPHQSTFIRSELLKEHPYSEDWKILGDWLWFREEIMVKKRSYKHLNFIVSDYNLEGLSSVHQNDFKAERSNYYLTKS